MTIYCRFYKFVVKFVVVMSLISWLVSVAGNVNHYEKKQLDDRCRYLMLVESWMCAAGWTLQVADAGRRRGWYVPNWSCLCCAKALERTREASSGFSVAQSCKRTREPTECLRPDGLRVRSQVPGDIPNPTEEGYSLGDAPPHWGQRCCIQWWNTPERTVRHATTAGQECPTTVHNATPLLRKERADIYPMPHQRKNVAQGLFKVGPVAGPEPTRIRQFQKCLGPRQHSPFRGASGARR